MTLLGRPLPSRLPDLTASPRTQPLANATLVARCDLTESLATFTIALDSTLEPFAPGQYVSIGIIDGGAMLQRPYSIVSLDGSGHHVELFIRRIPSGTLSARLWQLSIGARVRVGPARGLFTLDQNDQRPRVFVAAGTGLAPFVAMLDALARRHDGTPTTLIHSTSYQDELAFAERITAWMAEGLLLDYRPTVSRPNDSRNQGWTGFTGRAETQLERLVVENGRQASDYMAYLCGNPEMVESCCAVLLAGGLLDERIRIEQFHAPAGRVPVA